MKVLISSRFKKEESGIGRYYCNESYINALEKVGINSTIALPHPNHDYEDLADFYDGLLITGGEDVDPSFYHEPLHPETSTAPLRMDEMDMALFTAFNKRKKPILGICRGFQSINVALKGSLVQHLPDQTDLIHKQTSHRDQPTHRCDVLDPLIWNKPTIEVNSLHHQGIKVLAAPLKPLALASDQLIEAYYTDNVLAVQWHPEELCHLDDHLAIFTYFKKKMIDNSSLQSDSML